MSEHPKSEDKDPVNLPSSELPEPEPPENDEMTDFEIAPHSERIEVQIVKTDFR